MTSSVRSIVALLACLLLAGVTPATASGATGDLPPMGAIELTLDRSELATRIGESFSFRSKLTNTGTRPLRGLVASLNIVGLDESIYVDPEDWSSERTRFLDTLAPGASTQLSWRVTAVNGGELTIYVAVLPGRGPASALPGLSVSPALDVSISEQRTFNSDGVLPLALGIPLLLGLVTLGLNVRRRRSTQVT